MRTLKSFAITTIHLIPNIILAQVLFLFRPGKHNNNIAQATKTKSEEKTIAIRLIDVT